MRCIGDNIIRLRMAVAANRWPLTITLVFFTLYGLQTFTNHCLFRSYALDYGFYNQAFWDFAHLRANANTVFEPPLDHFLQVHPAFTLFIISPLYWLFSWATGTYSLLLIQNIFLAVGGIYTFRFIREKTGDDLVSLLAMVHYFILWGHFSALAADYIDVTVASSVVPVLFYCFYKRRYLAAGLAAVFIMLSRENMPIWMIFIALFFALTRLHHRPSLVFSAILMLISVAYLFVIFRIIIPSFENPSHPYWGFAYSSLGKNIPEALMTVVLHPWEAIRLLFVNQSGETVYNGIKGEFYLVFLLSGAVLLFTRPAWLLLFIPLIAQKMFNDHYLRWGINSFYSIEIVSVLSLSVWSAVAEFRYWKIPVKKWILFLTVVSTLVVTMVKMDTRKARWYDPVKEKIYTASFFRTGFDLKKIYHYLEQVPEGIGVCASDNVVPHLSHRHTITLFPYIRDTEMIFILLDSSTYPLSREQFEDGLEKLRHDPSWHLLVDDHPVMIFTREAGMKFTGYKP